MVELAVIVPTFNERQNVPLLLQACEAALDMIAYEVVFVDDDSPDGTADVVRRIAQSDSRVRCLQRIGRRGLASACIEGMLATAAPYIAVMDADLQHDERILPAMLDKLKREQLDLVIASRNMPGGSMGEFARERVAISGLGRRVSAIICRCEVSDPMSGFFVLDRRFLVTVQHSLSGIGFKILVDLIASSPRPVSIGEVPYQFRLRAHGDSKLDILVLVEYLQLVADKLIGDFLPARFMLFSIVGAFGAVIHLAALGLLYRLMGVPFTLALAIGTAVAMVSNFALNNLITYRDRRLQGARGWLWGLLTFSAACSMGALMTVRMAEFLYRAGLVWYAAAAIGIAISSVWNFGITQLFTWRVGRRRARANAARAVSGMTL